MRAAILIAMLALCFANSNRAQRDSARSAAGARETPTPKPLVAPQSKVDFATEVKPILQARCQPCHFAGGKMYERLPFDRPETIRTLGTKLFTRIEDENEKRVIRDFLAQR
jgi:hypothetical protein